MLPGDLSGRFWRRMRVAEVRRKATHQRKEVRYSARNRHEIKFYLTILIFTDFVVTNISCKFTVTYLPRFP